jgi:hypothetical protein
MMVQELRQSAAVIDHRYLFEDHPKTCHEQNPRERNKESKNESGEGAANGDCTSVG